MEKAVYSAVLTPFKKDLTIDKKLFISHCEFLLKNNISLAPLGTTGEANSISISEKIDLIRTIANSDLSKEKIIIGPGNTSFVDAALLTKTAVENKIYSVLLLPPFYYKNVSDEGVYQYYKEIINTIKSINLRIFLLINSPSDLLKKFINLAASIFTLVVALMHPEQPICSPS